MPDELAFISDFERQRKVIKQVSTPDAMKRQSPANLYHHINKESSHRVHSNVGSNTNSFINPSITSNSAIDSKWNHLNRIAQNNGLVRPNDMRNHQLRNQKALGGLTHDFGSSLSSYDKHNLNLKNHKLS